MINLILPLMGTFWLALHTSQSLMDLMDLVLMAIATYMAFKESELQKLFRSYRPYWIFLGWSLTIAIGYLIGFEADLSRKLVGYLEFRWMFSFLCYIYLLKKIKWTDKRFNLLNIILLASSSLNLIIHFIETDGKSRAGGLFFNSMSLAHTLGPAILLLLFFNLKRILNIQARPRERIFSGLCVLISLLLLVLTMTRGVWIGAFVGFYVAAYFLGKKFFWRSLLVGGLMATSAIALSPRLQQRVFAKTTNETESNRERVYIWKANINIFKDRPVFGVGYGINNLYLPQYLKQLNSDWDFQTHAHNQYLHFLSGTGIVGLFFYLAFLISILKEVVRSLKLVVNKSTFPSDLESEALILIGGLAAIVCFMTGSLTEANFSIAKNRYLFLFVSALLITLAQKMTQESVKGSSD